MTITGTFFNYFMVCRRKLWLFAHGITMEQESDLVYEGKLIHENTYPERNPNYEDQAKTYENKKRRTELAKKFIQGAAWNMVVNLNYYNRRGKKMADQINGIRQLAKTLDEAKSVEEVMGIEGNIRKIYYDCFDIIIDDFCMGDRTKQPPQNEVNALISFGNMMCYTETLRAIHLTQLNPTISFLHTPGERRYSLSLDISEIFKPILVDRVIFKTLNKHILSPKCLRQATQLLSDERGGEKTFCEGHGRALRGNFPAPLVSSECQLSAPHQAGMLQAAERHHGARRIQTF